MCVFMKSSWNQWRGNLLNPGKYSNIFQTTSKYISTILAVRIYVNRWRDGFLIVRAARSLQAVTLTNVNRTWNETRKFHLSVAVSMLFPKNSNQRLSSQARASTNRIWLAVLFQPEWHAMYCYCQVERPTVAKQMANSIPPKDISQIGYE